MHTPAEETIYEDDFQKISYHRSGDYLTYTVQELPPDTTHLRSDLLKILEIPLIKDKLKCAYLADLSKVNFSYFEEEIWLDEVILPQILSREVSKMACVLSPRLMPQMAMDYLVNRVIPPTCELRFFDNTEEAQQWLNNSCEGF